MGLIFPGTSYLVEIRGYMGLNFPNMADFLEVC
jgi:hypothetical protein